MQLFRVLYCHQTNETMMFLLRFNFIPPLSVLSSFCVRLCPARERGHKLTIYLTDVLRISIYTRRTVQRTTSRRWKVGRCKELLTQLGEDQYSVLWTHFPQQSLTKTLDPNIWFGLYCLLTFLVSLPPYHPPTHRDMLLFAKYCHTGYD